MTKRKQDEEFPPVMPDGYFGWRNIPLSSDVSISRIITSDHSQSDNLITFVNILLGLENDEIPNSWVVIGSELKNVPSIIYGTNSSEKMRKLLLLIFDKEYGLRPTDNWRMIEAKLNNIDRCFEIMAWNNDRTDEKIPKDCIFMDHSKPNRLKNRKIYNEEIFWNLNDLIQKTKFEAWLPKLYGITTSLNVPSCHFDTSVKQAPFESVESYLKAIREKFEASKMTADEIAYQFSRYQDTWLFESFYWLLSKPEMNKMKECLLATKDAMLFLTSFERCFWLEQLRQNLLNEIQSRNEIQRSLQRSLLKN